MEFKQKYQELQASIDLWLDRHLLEVLDNQLLSSVAHYSVKAPGKRFRPILVLAIGEMLNIPHSRLYAPCVALECIHVSSLIHDDLPCLDDDDIRRGQPSLHKVVGEGAALLAGAALISHAQRLLLGSEISDKQQLLLLLTLVVDAYTDICLGQYLDISHQTDSTFSKDKPRDAIDFVYSKKTGSLIQAALLAPFSFIADTPQMQLERAQVKSFGSALGLLFQYVDDLGDLHQTSNELNLLVHYDRATVIEWCHELACQAREQLLLFAKEDKKSVQFFEGIIDLLIGKIS